MAITSTININTVAGTISSSVYLNGSTLIDTLTYTESTTQISFVGSLTSVTLSVEDFLALLNFYVVFNQLIVTTYGTSQFLTKPFSEIVYIQQDNGTSSLEFEFLPGSIPLFLYTCTYPSGTVLVGNRTLPNTLSYAQWLFFIYLVANFRLSVLFDYNL